MIKSIIYSVDRRYMLKALSERLENPQHKNLIERLLLPLKIFLDDDNYFFQDRGVPQGSPISPLLFATYLDAVFKENGLLDFNLLAYLDDVVFILDNEKELN